MFRASFVLQTCHPKVFRACGLEEDPHCCLGNDRVHRMGKAYFWQPALKNPLPLRAENLAITTVDEKDTLLIQKHFLHVTNM